MNYATASTQSLNQPKSQTVLSSIEDFDPVLGRLESIAQKASGCAERITGPRPSEVSATEQPPSPNGLIYAVQERRSRLVRIVDYLESEMNRIENSLA